MVRSSSCLSVVLILLLGACSGVRSLSSKEGAAGPPLSDGERALVRGQVEAALEAGRFADAWNQQLLAHAGQPELEAIATRALEAESNDAADMLVALRDKWGPLSTGARQRVDDLIRDRMAAGRFTDAAEIAITTADDAPAFSHAFRIYVQAPARKAVDVLDAIQAARLEASQTEPK